MAEAGSPDRPYRFALTTGWLAHAFKSATRQDHAALRPILRPLLPPGGIAIDVGAHGGQVTRLLAALSGPDGHVYAVEPSGYSRSILRVALWSRGIRNVSVVATALGAEPGIVPLRTPLKKRGDMGYGLAHIGRGAAIGGVVELVAIVTLDQLIDALAPTRLDFIKVDIEGHEAAFIAGAGRTLQRFRPVLLMEHNASHLARAGATLAGLWGALTAAGYRPFKFENPSVALEALTEGDVFWKPGG